MILDESCFWYRFNPENGLHLEPAALPPTPGADPGGGGRRDALPRFLRRFYLCTEGAGRLKLPLCIFGAGDKHLLRTRGRKGVPYPPPVPPLDPRLHRPSLIEELATGHTCLFYTKQV